jgi:hypothetical protein
MRCVRGLAPDEWLVVREVNYFQSLGAIDVLFPQFRQQPAHPAIG